MSDNTETMIEPLEGQTSLFPEKEAAPKNPEYFQILHKRAEITEAAIEKINAITEDLKDCNEARKRLNAAILAFMDTWEQGAKLFPQLPEIQVFYSVVFTLQETGNAVKKQETTITATLIGETLHELFPAEFEALEKDIQAKNPTTGGKKKGRKMPQKKKADNNIQEVFATLYPEEVKSHKMPNNALANKLQSAKIITADSTPFDVQVLPTKGSTPATTVYALITYKEGSGIAPFSLTEDERQISDAITSIYVAKTQANELPIITPLMVYRNMPGNSDHASPKRLEEIETAIEKMRRIHVYVDATDEFRRRKLIMPDATMKFDAYYLSLTGVDCRIANGGQRVKAYHIDTEPIIWRYANMVNEVISIPSAFLKLPMDMTAERQALTGYLARRIAIMKHDKEQVEENQRKYDIRRKYDSSLPEKEIQPKLQQNILFSSAFDDAGITTDSRTAQNRYRDFCFEVMEEWTQMGFIKGYSKQMDGRSIKGIIVEL